MLAMVKFNGSCEAGELHHQAVPRSLTARKLRAAIMEEDLWTDAEALLALIVFANYSFPLSALGTSSSVAPVGPVLGRADRSKAVWLSGGWPL